MFLFLCTGTENQHETSVPADHGTTVQPLPQTGQVQETPLRSVLLPQRAAGEKKISHVGLEYTVRFQRLRLRGKIFIFCIVVEKFNYS